MRNYVLLTLLVTVAACGEQAGAAGEPEALLSCAGGKTVSSTVDHDDSTKETRSPEEQATAYAAAQAGAFSGAQKMAYESDDRVDVTFVDASSRVTAVLSYSNDGDLGWRLKDAISCA